MINWITNLVINSGPEVTIGSFSTGFIINKILLIGLIIGPLPLFYLILQILGLISFVISITVGILTLCTKINAMRKKTNKDG